MSKRKELLQTIADIENGLAMNPTGEILERLTNRLQRAKDQLAKLDDQQKKSIAQPSEKPEQLPDMEQRRERENKAVYFEEKRQKSAVQQSSSMQRFIKTVAAVVAPPPIEVQDEIAIEYRDNTGKVVEVETFTMRKLTSKNQQYFAQIFDGKRFEAVKSSEADENSREMEELMKNVRKGKQYYKLFVRCVSWAQSTGRMMTIKELQDKHYQMGENNKRCALILYNTLKSDVEAVLK